MFVAPGVVRTALSRCGFVHEATLRGAISTAAHMHRVGGTASDGNGDAEAPVEDELLFGLLRTDAVQVVARAAPNSATAAVPVVSSSTTSAGARWTADGDDGDDNSKDDDTWWRGGFGRSIMPVRDVMTCMVDNLDKLHGIMYFDRVMQGALLEWMIGVFGCPGSDAPSFEVRTCACSQVGPHAGMLFQPGGVISPCCA